MRLEHRQQSKCLLSVTFLFVTLHHRASIDAARDRRQSTSTGDDGYFFFIGRRFFSSRNKLVCRSSKSKEEKQKTETIHRRFIDQTSAHWRDGANSVAPGRAITKEAQRAAKATPGKLFTRQGADVTRRRRRNEPPDAQSSSRGARLSRSTLPFEK